MPQPGDTVKFTQWWDDKPRRGRVVPMTDRERQRHGDTRVAVEVNHRAARGRSVVGVRELVPVERVEVV